MTYKELVRLVLDKVLELNSENIEVTMSKDQFTCWFADGPTIQGNINIHVDEDNAYEINYWDEDNYATPITVDEMFKMINIKGDK